MNKCHWLHICVYLAHSQLNGKSVEIYEHILSFITIYNSTGAGMNDNILNMCQNRGLPLFV